MRTSSSPLNKCLLTRCDPATEEPPARARRVIDFIGPSENFKNVIWAAIAIVKPAKSPYTPPSQTRKGFVRKCDAAFPADLLKSCPEVFISILFRSTGLTVPLPTVHIIYGYFCRPISLYM